MTTDEFTKAYKKHSYKAIKVDYESLAKELNYKSARVARTIAAKLKREGLLKDDKV